MATPRLGQKVFEEAIEKREEKVTIAETTVDPEKAAEALVSFLPPDTLAFIKEAATSFNLPLWQMLLGYVMRCADRMDLYYPHIMSAWSVGVGAKRERACHNCGIAFGSEFPEAMYCCPNCYFNRLHDLGHTEVCPTKAKN